ncbi:hypothetical protein TTHERM_00932040 (macronuclear) [Tetrahymena thermophila SB210]|uniref:Uncharacterized protein n=1 Tax=Tetrahymena thermophila (strain SB210) TaxID=312017 RepID=I7LWF4_TETTS|nr:hypothetical protein TTHERM_00932040 [Tetrahymena thermophila SB210]EAS01614.1 hypothetical protein TTHERM_00932040 [Tetrahymena thermophila SB210]|eukprot:XP_001021859.1 hypothetical protein TTHERM_00932040 [Tetrahymena thermophila SB210]
MEDLIQENEARKNLLECLDENNDIDLYLSGMDKSKLKIDQSQSKPNQEIGSWESDGQNILSSLGEYQSKQRNDNNSHISKATVDSKTQLSTRFLSSYRRQNPSQGGNLQTVYSSLTNNNSNVIRLNSISPQQVTDEKNMINISTISKNDTQEEQMLINTQQSNQVNQQTAIDSYEQQAKQNEIQSSWVFMSPNYIEHRKQLQVGMLIDRHNLKNRKTQQGQQKTIESATFNDKNIILEINQDVVQQNYADVNQKQETLEKAKQKFKAIQCKQITMPQDLNKDASKSIKLKSEQNGQDLFKQYNYYDVQEMKGQDSLDTLNIKNELKKYKNLRPGTYIGIVPKKETSSSQDNNFYVLKNNQLSNTLDLSKLKLLQSTNTPFQSSRIRRKKQNYSGDYSLTDRFKEQDLQNLDQITQENIDKEQENFQLNIVKYPNQKSSREKIYSQTSRNSFSLNEHNDFSEKFREQVQQNTQTDIYSPLKPKFTLNCNEQKSQQKKVKIKGGGGFYYLKDDMLFKIDKEDELIQQLNSFGEYNIQLHPIQKFIEHEKKKENIQIQKMQQKEQEVYIIQQDLQQRELNYSPTSLVNKYTNQMRDNPKLKKNLFYVNKKLNKLERKKTIEEFRARSNSPLAQIIDAVNQNPLIKQSTTFYSQKNALPVVRSSYSPQILKCNKQKGISDLIYEQQNVNHNQNQSQPLGQTQYKKYRKWKGSPLFNLENNDLNRNPYINCGFSPLLAQQSPVQFSNKSRNQTAKKKNNQQQQQQNSQIQQFYNPIPQIFNEQTKKYKTPLQN